MQIKPFELERYFAKYEFSTPYILSASDCEALTLNELLDSAKPETKELWQNLKLGYTESQGLPELRNEITKLYKTIQPDQAIIITPEEGIFIAMNVLLKAGDHVIVTSPGYQSLTEIAASIGADVTHWQPDPKTWQFDVNFIKDNLKANTKLIVINFPHNPTGAQLKREQLDEIIEIAKAKGIHIFSDEMYRLLEYDEADRLPSTADIYDKGISLFGVSKSFSLPGLRIGWLTTKDKQLYDDIATFKDYTTICSSAPSEILALMALQNKDAIVAKNLSIIQSNIASFNDFCKRQNAKVGWQAPKAGSVAFAEIIGHDVDKVSQELISKKGVIILPASVYSYKSNNFRVGLGRTNFNEALKLVEDYLNEL
jgi:aspartate/methionine/tyrosine aminotransferase